MWERSETVKILEENIKKKFLDIGLINDFLAIPGKAQITKTNIDKWDDFKLKSFCIKKKTITKWKANYRMGENICKPYME